MQIIPYELCIKKKQNDGHCQEINPHPMYVNHDLKILTPEKFDPQKTIA